MGHMADVWERGVPVPAPARAAQPVQDQVAGTPSAPMAHSNGRGRLMDVKSICSTRLCDGAAAGSEPCTVSPFIARISPASTAQVTISDEAASLVTSATGTRPSACEPATTISGRFAGPHNRRRDSAAPAYAP